MRIPSGTTDQVIYFVAVDATDFTSRETGLSSFTVYRSRNGGTAAAFTTPTVTEVDATNMPGVYKLLLDEDMTIDSGDDSQEMAFHITHAGMAPVTRTIELYRPKITVGETLTVSSGDVGVYEWNSVSLATTNPLPNAAPDAAGGLVVSDTGGADIDTLISTANTTAANVVTVDTVVDAIKVVTDALPDSGALTTITTHLTQIKGTGFVADTHSLTNIEGYADLIDDGTSGLAKIATDVAAILVDTADIQPKLGTVSDLGGGATVAANLSDLAGATFSTATDSLEAIRDRGDAAWTTGAGGTPPDLLQSTTIATLASQTSFTLTAGSADDDAYNGAIAVITDSATSTQKAVASVSDYVGSTKTVTLAADPAIFTMAVGDTIAIIAATGTGPTAAAIRAEIDSNSTQLAAIVADTNELQTNQGNWLTATTVDLNADQSGVTIGTVNAMAGTITTLDALDTAQDSQHSTTQAAVAALSIPTAAAIRSEIDANSTQLAAILLDTGTTLPAQIAALNNLSAAQVNAEVVDALATDTYAELGAVPAATASLAEKLSWVFMLSRNKLTQTATTAAVRNDADGANVATATVSDDGTTFIRGEYS